MRRKTGTGRPRAVRFLFAVLALLARSLPAAPAKTVTVSPELSVSIEEGEEIFVSARPLTGETLDAFARRLTDDPKTKDEIVRSNEGLRALRRETMVRVPYRLLSGNHRRIAIEALFPQDRADARGWTHVVSAPAGHPESLWRIAEWFTGDGAHYREIRSEGGIASLQTETGQMVFIPARLLLPAFRNEAVSGEAEASPLEFGRDEKGRYAVYRIQRGEALYSAVVVRFTGRVHAEDVNAKASEIATRSGITDVRSIPVGFAVKIPLEDLSPEFRPLDDPARIEEEKARLETAQFANRIRAADLSGITFVLDAGHGGKDVGADVDGVQEASHVYDLACRVEMLLRKHTRARVVTTVQGRTPCRANSTDVVTDWRTARVLTHPPYPIEDTVAGVNFRWYLANAVLRESQKKGGSADRTVFVSLHADSLHPAVRGLMVYIPGEKFLKGSFERAGEVYASRREVKEASHAAFTRQERIQSEGLSRDLAERIVAAFRSANLPLHAFQPIRRNVIRGGREWVPAILRYNRIPTRALLEICNLNNPEDRRLLVTRSYRDRVARALVSALIDFYGGNGTTLPPVAAEKHAAGTGR